MSSNSLPSLISAYAPGILIGDSRKFNTGRQSGTSMAAPHVAGEIAILRGTNAYGTTKSPDEIISLVKNWGLPVKDRLATSTVKGRINIAKALNPPGIRSLSISPSSIQLQAGVVQGYKVLLAATDNAGDPMVPNAGWSSSNTGVASVDSNGIVTALSSGSTTISATLGGLNASSTLTVQNVRIIPPPNCSKNPALCY